MLLRACSALKQIMSIAASNFSRCIAPSNAWRSSLSPLIKRTPSGNAPDLPRLKQTTSWPSSTNRRTILVLMFPVPPTMHVFMDDTIPTRQTECKELSAAEDCAK